MIFAHLLVCLRVAQVWWEPNAATSELDEHAHARRPRHHLVRRPRKPSRQTRGQTQLHSFKSSTISGTSGADRAEESVGLQTLFSAICSRWCLLVLHPDGPFRSGWNVCLACIIIYCGFAIPLEIAFEADMARAMCRDPTDPFGAQIPRGECGSFLLWFWLNVVVDLWFITDIVLSFRTGYVHEGYFVNDSWLVAKAYLRGSFFFDVLGIATPPLHAHTH